MKIFWILILLFPLSLNAFDFKFGIVPSEGGGNDIKEKFTPFMEYLSSETKHKVHFFPASDYASVVTALCNGNIDFAYLGPKSYVEAKNKCNVTLMAKEINAQGFSGYTGLIIARSDLPITSIKEGKNRTFAFTGPNSTSGHLVPSISFLKSNPPITPHTFFKDVKFSGSHMASILSIKNKTIDLAATNNIDLRNMLSSGKVQKTDYKIIWESDLIPGAVIASKYKSHDQEFQMLEKIITRLPPSITAILGNGGFEKANDNEYNIIRYLMSVKKRLESKP